MHTSSVSNNLPPVTKVIKSVASSNTSTNTTQTQNVNIMTERKKEEEIKKKARDLTTPYICEWIDCNM